MRASDFRAGVWHTADAPQMMRNKRRRDPPQTVPWLFLAGVRCLVLITLLAEPNSVVVQTVCFRDWRATRRLSQGVDRYICRYSPFDRCCLRT